MDASQYMHDFRRRLFIRPHWVHSWPRGRCCPAHSLLELREGRSVVARVSARLRGVAGCVLNPAMQNEVDELIIHAASPPALPLPAPLIGLARST